MLKKLLIPLTLLFVFMFSTQVSADELDSNVIWVDPVSGEEIIKAYKVTSSGLEEMDIEEFKKVREENRKKELQFKMYNHTEGYEDAGQIQPSYVATYYRESGNYYYYGTPIAVSGLIRCPAGSTPCSITRTIGASATESFSANASGEHGRIRVGASFTWTRSASISTSYTIGVDPGRSGRMMFQPRLRRTYGVLEWSSVYGGIIAREHVTGNSPVKLWGGDLDGIVYLARE